MSDGAQTRFPLRPLIAAAILAATLAVYWQVGGHPFVLYDDDEYLTENPPVRDGLTADGVRWAFTTFHAFNWHPLTWISHMIDVSLFGMSPAGHHLASVALHALNAALLFLLLSRSTGAPWRSGFAAALFALHPLHVESVAWVAERKDLLSTFFWILSMLAYVRYAERPGLARYLPVPVFLALGLMAKPMPVTAPFVLLLLDAWPLGRMSTVHFPRLLLEKVPLLALAAASCVVTYIAQAEGGAVSTLISLSPAERIANAIVAYASYAAKTVWPSGLSVFYPHPGGSLPAWKIVLSAAFLAAATVLVVRLRKVRPYLPVGWFWYLGTLVPVIGLVQVGGQAMADRYTYVPLIGLFIMASWGIPDLVPQRPWRVPGLAATAALALAALAAASVFQVRHWRSNIALFGHALEVTPGNWLAHNNIGVALGQEGRSGEALSHYRECVRIKPDYAKAYFNWGNAHLQQGHWDEAASRYREALRIRPEFAKARSNLGNALLRAGRTDEAIAVYRETLRADPDAVLAHNNLGVALALGGDDEGAAAHFREYLRRRPGDANAHALLGEILLRSGRREEGMAEFREALRIAPDDPVVREKVRSVLSGKPRQG